MKATAIIEIPVPWSTRPIKISLSNPSVFTIAAIVAIAAIGIYAFHHFS